MRKLTLSLVTLGFLEAGSLLTAFNVWAGDLYVPSASYPIIQSAINAANTGDTVWVVEGIYTGTQLLWLKLNLEGL